MRLSVAQINTTVGNIHPNQTKILTYIEKANQESIDILIFPELALCGYPPEDLLFQPSFLAQVDEAFKTILQHTQETIVILGHPRVTNQGLMNTATVMQNGNILLHYDKQALPNYSVFDERRYFTPGSQPGYFTYQDKTIGLMICEDLWQTEPYDALFKEVTPDIVISLNASPFRFGKLSKRQEIVSQRCQAHPCPILYAHMVGGQDELIFDGGSFITNAAGEICDRAPFFEETLFTIKLPDEGTFSKKNLPEPDEQTLIYQALCLGLQDYLKKNNFERTVLGVSGGIDSALSLVVACDAIGPENVSAVLLPSRYTEDISKTDAHQLCNNLGVTAITMDIEPTYLTLLTTLGTAFDSLDELTKQNLQARARGILLMAHSNQTGSLLLTTSNKSELAVGYGTLYGDMAGGFNVLKDIYKTRVYALARHRNEIEHVIPDRIITRPPSAELAPNQKDTDTLPDYDLLDAILQHYIESDLDIDTITNAIQQDFPSYGADVLRKTIEEVIHRTKRNEFKRRQAAPGIRVTKKAFGRDRRLPISQVF